MSPPLWVTAENIISEERAWIAGNVWLHRRDQVRVVFIAETGRMQEVKPMCDRAHQVWLPYDFITWLAILAMKSSDADVMFELTSVLHFIHYKQLQSAEVWIVCAYIV